MPNPNYNSFLAIYRSAVVCKKIRFCIPWTVLNFLILKVLVADGYIRSYKFLPTKFEINAVSLAISTKFNRILNFSTAKRPIAVNFSKLLILTKTGGYFVLSTKLGIMNDSKAWELWIGGILLFAIF